MSNTNILIADVISFVYGRMITFSQGGAAKIQSEQFSEFGFRTMSGHHIIIILKYQLIYLKNLKSVSEVLSPR